MTIEEQRRLKELPANQHMMRMITASAGAAHAEEWFTGFCCGYRYAKEIEPNAHEEERS